MIRINGNYHHGLGSEPMLLIKDIQYLTQSDR